MVFYHVSPNLLLLISSKGLSSSHEILCLRITGNSLFLSDVLLISIIRVGIESPTIEVRFDHLNIDAAAYIGGRAIPTVLNFTINVVEVVHMYKTSF